MRLTVNSSWYSSGCGLSHIPLKDQSAVFLLKALDPKAVRPPGPWLWCLFFQVAPFVVSYMSCEYHQGPSPASVCSEEPPSHRVLQNRMDYREQTLKQWIAIRFLD